MKNIKLYCLIGLLGSTSYLIQRALLILTKQIDIAEIQAQSQTQGAFSGLDLSFSYLGMNMYWPFIVALFLFGYKKASNLGGNQKLFIEFNRSKLLSLSILVALPAVALSLHFFSILEFTGDQMKHLFSSFDDIKTYGQGTISAPSIAERVAALVIIVATILSFLVSVYSLFIKEATLKNA
jgi:hypothetical protein